MQFLQLRFCPKKTLENFQAWVRIHEAPSYILFKLLSDIFLLLFSLQQITN